MKRTHLLMTICTAAIMTVGVTAVASAQARTRVAVQAHTQFYDHGRQVTCTWYD